MPLYYNKYIHKQGKCLVPSATVQKVVESVAVNLGDLYVENSNEDSHRVRTPEELNDWLGTHTPGSWTGE